MADLKDCVRAYYDEFAGVYDTKHGVSGAGQAYNFRTYYEPFLTRHVPAGSRVLELGCGTGVYTRWLTDRGCTVTAMDISPAMIEQARKRSPDATYVVGDCERPLEHLPEEDRRDAFDIILGINTFSYYPNKESALKGYYNLLKPGGRIVFIDMNGTCPLYRIMKWTGKNEMPQWYPHIRQSNDRRLRELAGAAGLRIAGLTHFVFIPNALGSLAVTLLRPIDALLSRLPLIRNWSMRVALLAERT
ncbi:MAG: methyltransferase domain-containing protein [Phycisphaerae bacterium]|nr:methyltransferase domain-containing protein [Phycisphaerae bacterium]